MRTSFSPFLGIALAATLAGASLAAQDSATTNTLGTENNEITITAADLAAAATPPPPPSGPEIGRYVGHNGVVTSLCVLPGRHWLAAGGEDATIILFDTTHQADPVTLRGHSAEILALAASPTALLSGSQDSSAMLWTLPTGASRWKIQAPGPVGAVALAPDGSVALLGLPSGEVQLVRVASGEVAGQITAHPAAITALALSRDGRVLATGSADHSIKLWDAPGAALIRILGTQDHPVGSIAITSNNRYSLSTGDKAARFWDNTTGQLARTLQSSQTTTTLAVLAQDDRTGVIVTADGVIHVWRVDEARELGSLSAPALGSRPAVALDDAGTTVFAGATDGTVRVLQIPSGSPGAP